MRPAPRVACPACGKPSRFEPANRWRPFCSERCKTVDLGAWAAGRYVIAGAETPMPDDDPSGGASATSR